MLKKILTIFLHHEFIFLTVFGNLFIVITATIFYLIEKTQNEHLETFTDALWWAVVTMTTVGYGDIVPATLLGRFVAFGTMMIGLVIIAFIPNLI